MTMSESGSPAEQNDVAELAPDLSQAKGALDRASTDRMAALARHHAEYGVIPHRSPYNLANPNHIREMDGFLRRATAQFRKKSVEEPLSYAAEWMLDNFHLVEQSLREAAKELPAGYYRQLPELGAGPWAGYPRIYDVAQDL